VYSAGDVYTISGGSRALQRHLLLGAAAISLTLDCVYHAFFSCIMWVPLNVAELGLVRDKLYYQHVPCWTHLADMLHLAATSWVAVIIGWRVAFTHYNARWDGQVCVPGAGVQSHADVADSCCRVSPCCDGDESNGINHLLVSLVL